MQQASFINLASQEDLSMDPFESNPHSKSCDDLLSEKSEISPVVARSISFTDLTNNQREPNFVQNQSKQYLELEKRKMPNKELPKCSKEEYLQEINDRLLRELEEKNAVLLQLQENYEHLLLKYAEAQNKIDNLRFRNSINEEVMNDGHESKPYLRNLEKPQLYSRKNIEEKIAKQNLDCDLKIDRPSTLAVEGTMNNHAKDIFKAVTPTDSEGVDSVVTSMSGHSKIINDFDDSIEDKKPMLKPEILENVLPVNDPFDKVKHWQNSLPPLDMIETPDTALYDVQPASQSTRYNELFNIPETPESVDHEKPLTQSGMKKYLRTLSLPSSLTRRNILSQIYKMKNNHTIDASSPVSIPEQAQFSPPQEGLEDRILRRKTRPPFLRSSSVPAYDNETPKSTIRCRVPPLDLDNLTLSDAETSLPSQSHEITCSQSCLTSFQTLDSLNTCKATMSDDYSPCFVHQSSSITPDKNGGFPLERSDYLNCHVCGEVVAGNNRAASFHGIHKLDSDTKYSICRSLSCNSGALSPDQNRFQRRSVEAFDLYANELKTRSKITMRALTAHVNHS